MGEGSATDFKKPSKPNLPKINRFASDQVCTAYNLKKLIAALAALRAEGGEMAVNVKG
jgi:hypothetical protein